MAMALMERERDLLRLCQVFLFTSFASQFGPAKCRARALDAHAESGGWKVFLDDGNWQIARRKDGLILRWVIKLKTHDSLKM